ncbi:MAG: phosphate signaling complex PhoU family protein [Acidimicrobiales bacterium]
MADFVDELDGLRLQVEVMALLVEEALAKAVELVKTGDPDIAASLVAGDDEIDAIGVSLTERCYDLLMQQSLMATNLRLVVSVIRVLASLERIGDLCLRIAKRGDDVALLQGHPEVYAVIDEFGATATERFGVVTRAWSSGKLTDLDEARADRDADDYGQLLMSRLLELEGADAVRVAIAAFVIGRSFDRIGDHTNVMASRLRYLVTGDPSYLAEEVAE